MFEQVKKGGICKTGSVLKGLNMTFQEFVIIGCYWPARRPWGRKTRFLERKQSH
jgi:hypothetical protein